MQRLLFLIFLISTVSSATADVRTEPVAYQDGEVKLQGWLVYDSSVKEKRPGVLIVRGWWGLTEYAKRRAEDYA